MTTMLQQTISTEEPKVVPLRGVRAMIADKMVSSLQEGAQLTHHASCDISGLLGFKQRMADEGVKLSVEDIVNHCVVQVLKRHPDINGTVKGKEIHLSSSVDLCVAIALPGNLLVAPTIFGADRMDPSRLREVRRDLIARARSNKLTVTEMTSGTFTVSNLGLTRVEHFTPIINSPQIGIVGIGCSTQRAILDDEGNIALRPYVGLSLTFDHRAIDGGPAGDILTDLCNTIEAVA